VEETLEIEEVLEVETHLQLLLLKVVMVVEVHQAQHQWELVEVELCL